MPENKKFWKFCNQVGNTVELLLYGDISQTSWWGDEVTPRQFAEELAGLGALDKIVVRINSGGGDVFAAQAIGNQLEQHPAEVTAKIDGLCASAATIVACHCGKVIAANDSTYMVHPVRRGAYGYYNAEELKKYIEALDAIRESITGLYAKKTGREKDEVAGWMDETKWWTAQQAKENGFIDELVDDAEETVVENRDGMLFVNSVNMHLPFDKAPDFVQSSKAAKTAADCFVNKNCHKEVKNMANEIKTVDDLRGAYPALVNEIEEAAAQQARSDERQRIQDIEEKCKRIIAANHIISPDDKKAISGFNLGEQFEKVNGLLNGISLLTWIVGLGTLLAGIVGVSNIMLVIVRERTQEIGVRRAIGARPWSIISQILSESFLLTFIAGILGLAAGVGALSVFEKLIAATTELGSDMQPLQISFGLGITATLIIIAGSLLAGIIPASRAMKIKAVDAIREE